ncbi:MAG TPA: hypothetical protein VLY24_04850 [Bryobacteraceae bacterium]|nr:hypothetical protein [Bryobacteraceae bacterium]
MLKKWFPLAFAEEPVPQNGVSRKQAAQQPAQTADSASDPAPPKTTVLAAAHPREPAKYLGFEQIYTSAAVKPPRAAYGILKVAEMVNSAHLTGMSAETRRCSLLMALEAAGAEVEDLLQDAVVRQKALNDYEHNQQQRLKEFEAAKLEENTRIQSELERITAQYLARVQANLDEVAREQDSLRTWQREKHQESQRITEAATFCVPQGNAANGSTLTAVLERATFVRR